jgi:hypothetical protein
MEQPKEAAPKEADKNWHYANQVMEMQKKRIQELEQLHQNNQVKAPVEERDEFDDLDPNDAVTVFQARKMAEKMAEKKAMEAAKRMMQEYSQTQAVATDEARMRAKHEDYDYVLENYALPLIKNDPALAHKIQNSKNPAETAYRLGKMSDDYEEGIMKKETSPKAEKILKNTSRPLSANAASSSLKGQADKFSNMSKADVWAESQKYARGA